MNKMFIEVKGKPNTLRLRFQVD